MVDFTFELNWQKLSALKSGALSFPAFSGFGAHVNKKETVCLARVGAIPPGQYYIFDRQSGGLLGALKDAFSGKDQWFALYAIDTKIDDEMICNAVERGNFRLHPKGPLGISEGCITIERAEDFHRLRSIIKGSSQILVPGAQLKAYGKVTVR
jgi:hypothetical protein